MCHAHGTPWACEARHDRTGFRPLLAGESRREISSKYASSPVQGLCLTCPPKAVGMARNLKAVEGEEGC